MILPFLASFVNSRGIMKLQIKYKGKGFSVNAAYGRNHALTAPARRWKLDFHKNMLSYMDEAALFSRAFDPLKHSVQVSIENYMSNLYTKEGKVSHSSMDVDNLNKLTLDGIFAFLPAIDDCAITQLSSSKHYSAEDYIIITLQLSEFTLPKK